MVLACIAREGVAPFPRRVLCTYYSRNNRSWVRVNLNGGSHTSTTEQQYSLLNSSTLYRSAAVPVLRRRLRVYEYIVRDVRYICSAILLLSQNAEVQYYCSLYLVSAQVSIYSSTFCCCDTRICTRYSVLNRLNHSLNSSTAEYCCLLSYECIHLWCFCCQCCTYIIHLCTPSIILCVQVHDVNILALRVYPPYTAVQENEYTGTAVHDILRSLVTEILCTTAVAVRSPDRNPVGASSLVLRTTTLQVCPSTGWCCTAAILLLRLCLLCSMITNDEVYRYTMLLCAVRQN